eukprot:7207655-Ditylum_brightwellii.AAC.1
MFGKMKSYLSEANQTALTHVDIPDQAALWQWILPIWNHHFDGAYTPTWIVILDVFLADEAWEKIVTKFGTFGPHKRVVDKEQLDFNLAKQYK